MREVAAVLPRREQWKDLAVDVTLRLVGNDLDENDRDHNQLWKELQYIKRLLIGILISTTTASILLAINLVTGSLG